MKFIIQQLADALAFWSVHGLCDISAPREKILDKMCFQSLVLSITSLLRLSLLFLCLPHYSLVSKYYWIV